MGPQYLRCGSTETCRSRDGLYAPCEDVAIFDPPISLGATELTEIVDEELFLEQSQTSSVDQAAFDAAMDQLEQSVADRILVLQRARARAVSSRDKAQSARDSALGSEKRAAAEGRVRALKRNR